MADNIITTNITANADFTSLRTQLAAVTAQLVKLQETTAGTNAKLANQIAVMNKSFAETMRSTGQFSTHFVSLSSDVDKFGKNLDRGRLKLNEYYNAWSGHTKKTSNLIKDLAKQQVMLENAIIQPIGKNAQGLMQYNVMVGKGLDEVKNKMALARQEAAIMNKVMLDGSNQLINWGKNTQWAGRQLTVGLTVPLVAFGAAAQKAFREADAELVRLTKVYGGLAATSSADLAQVRKDVTATAKEIASSYGVAYKETIALAADLAATGQQGNDLIAATQQTTRLAVLGEVDRQDAMKATLAIQNAFKQNTDELAQSIDFLNAVENQTSTSLADLTEAIPKAGPVIKSLGGDVKDLALYLTAMKEGGVNAAEGANAIKSAMASLINPTKVATEQFAGFGIDLKGIVNRNAGNLTQTILDLQSALDGLNPLDKSRAIEQLFGKFQFARMSALFENLGKSGSQTLQVMDLMKASAVDLANISERELKMMTESASGQFKRAWASVQADLAQTGEQFLRISTKVLKVVDAIIKFFQNLPAPVKTFLNALGGLTAIAGPLIMMAGVMGNFIGYVVKGIFHLRQLAKGGSAFKLLTPEIMAAEAAAQGLATTFYSDSEATIVLSNAVNTLTQSFATLEAKANAAKVATGPAISTVAGNVIAAGTPGTRVVDKDNPLVGRPHSRDMQHLIPSGTEQAGTIFGVVPGAKPVNIRIGKNPQAYMSEDLPKVPGVSSINGTSTGIVASEAAKWHAMTAAIAMQSEAEIKALKAEVMATGTVTSSLTESYQALLPQFSEITDLAAAEVKAIVAEVQANKITVDQARAKILQLNATVEAMLIETTNMTATTMGRTAALTTVPLTGQPVVDPTTGKSNMKEMFHKGTTKEIADRIARALGGVRTSGAGYNIQTTKPKFAKGGIVPGTGNTDTYHTTAEAGSFVINKASTEANMPVIQDLLGGKPTYRNEGGQVPVVLTPGEAVVPADIAQKNMPLMHALNGGPGNTSGLGRSGGGGVREQAEFHIKGASSWAKRMHESSDWMRELKARYVINDAAVLNNLNMSEAEAIKIAAQHYDEAFDYAYDPKTDTVDDAKWAEAREAQTRALDKKLGGAILKPDDPIDKRTGKPKRQPIAAELPSPQLMDKMVDMGLLSRKEMDRIWDQIFKGAAWDEKTRKWIPTSHSYASEHDQRISTYGYRAKGNFGQAIAGNKEINSWTNVFSRLTRDHNSPFIDRIPRTETEKQKALDTVGKILGRGTGPGVADRIISAPSRLKYNFGITKEFLGFLISKKAKRIKTSKDSFNSGGQIPGEFAQRLFGGGGVKFLGMPKTIKQVEHQRAMRKAMEDAHAAVEKSRFAKKPVTDYGDLIEPTSGRSFPVPGIGGLYIKGDEKVFVKPVQDEKAALAEMRATEIARKAHGLDAPKQKIVVMKDPTDPTGRRKVLALESPYDPKLASTSGKFTTDEYFRQLLASSLRGDKDLGRGNLSGNVLSDVGTAGVFATASGIRDYSATIPSVKDQAMINLLGVKGSGAKKFFAESTLDIPAGMTADQYHKRMLEEIESTLPRLKETIASFDLNQEEKVVYAKMIKRLEDSRRANWAELHGIHSAVTPSKEVKLTPAALAKIKAAEELKRRQSGEIVSLSDMSFKSDANGFMAGGMIGNVLKGKAMNRIGAGFGPTGEPKPSMYESAPWGVNALSIEMANKLFADSGLRKHTQKLFYDKFAAALAKEKPYGYVKMPDGTLKNGLEPDILDAVVRSAASGMISDRSVAKQLSPIDKDILKKKYLNWDSKQETPMTEALRKLIFDVQPREKGGPVFANKPYLVGEKGPELFVPRNSGGIVPNNKYGIGGMIAPMIAATVAQMLGGKIGGMGGTALSTIGGILPFMFMGGMGGGAKKMAPNRSAWIPPEDRAPDWNAPKQKGFLASRVPAIDKLNLGKQIGPAAKLTKALEGGAAGGGKFASMLGRVALIGTRANLAIGAVSLAVALGIKRWKDHNEHLRIGALQYGLTEEAAKKAGLKFTNYNDKLSQTVENIKALRERNQLLYESMQDAGTPIAMTIEQYKKLRKEVKTTYADQIKLINQTKGDNNTKKVAEDIKIQLMAAGMSAEEATKKIWAMFKMSNKARDAARFTVGNSRFNRIETKQDAAARAVAGYGAAAKEGGKEGAGAVNTGLTAIDTGIQDMIEKSKKAAAADKSGNTKVLSQYEAQEKMLKRLNNLEESKTKISKETLDEMIKQNPEIKKIATEQDTVVSLWQKMDLAAKGFTGDLSKLGSEAVATLSKVADAISAATIAANKQGLLKDQYAMLDKLTAQQKALMKAAKGQSVAQQISTREQLKNLQKQIDANNKLAEARKKALEEKKNSEDAGRAIESKKIELQNAEATGNTAGAQQARLDLEGLIKAQQYESQIKAIDKATERANKPLQDKINAINDGQQKMSDNAALAGESLGKLNDKIATQKQKIDDVNTAMTTFRLNAAAAGKTLEEYAKTKAGKQDSAAIVSTAKNAGINVPTTGGGHYEGSTFVPDKKSVTAQALDLVNTTNDAVAKGLAAKGIEVNGDINIIGKNGVKTKADVSANVDAGGRALKTVTAKISTSGASAYTIGKGQLMNAGVPLIKGAMFLDSAGKKWVVGDQSDQMGMNFHVTQKAGYGTMKLDPKIPTIVGDRGPEMAFGGMIIPNMAKVPYASPRYDVNQAAKMFEPIRDNSGSGVINITQNIYPSDGMNTDAFVKQVVSMTKQAIGQDAKLNAKMVGTKRT